MIMFLSCWSLTFLARYFNEKKISDHTYDVGNPPDRHKIMAGLNQLIGSQSSPHDNWISSSVLFLIVEHVNIDTTCASWNLISDVFNSI